MTYYKSEKEKIICNLCRQHCKLSNNQFGICGINQNLNGVLDNITINHPSVMEVEPIEKSHLFHFLPNSNALFVGTVGCNMKCPFCETHELSQAKEINADIQATKEQIVALALKFDVQSIVYGYNEPTVFYPFAKEIGKLAKKHRLKNVFMTNGYQSSDMVEDMKSWVDAVSFDLKSVSREFYKFKLKADLNIVKENLISFVNSKIHTEITTLLIEDINTSEDELKEITKFINELKNDVPWHLLSFSPKYKMAEYPPNRLKSVVDAHNIGIKEGLKFIYFANVPTANETFCPSCDYSILRRDKDGKLNHNYIIENGNCPQCKRKVYGIW